MNNKDADQTARMRRLIWAFVVRIWHKTHFIMARLKCFTNFSDSACKNGHPEGEWANVYYGYTCSCLPPSSSPEIWAEAWQNQQNDLCIQRRLISLGICCLPEESLCSWLSIEHTAMPRLIRVFTGHTDHFAGFVVLRLIFSPKGPA